MFANGPRRVFKLMNSVTIAGSLITFRLEPADSDFNVGIVVTPIASWPWPDSSALTALWSVPTDVNFSPASSGWPGCQYFAFFTKLSCEEAAFDTTLKGPAPMG